jgi:hypothetical protein
MRADKFDVFKSSKFKVTVSIGTSVVTLFP